MSDNNHLQTHSPAPAADSLENRYYAYLRGQGYATSDALLDVLRVYLPYFEGLQHVADLGCGHGEFLALLRDAGHTVSGVDVDPGMVDACRGQGFEVALGDAAAWMLARPGQFDAIFSSNVIEHLPAVTVRAWVAAAHTALRPGGMLLFATPNPASAIVQFYEFWRDATHVRLYAAQLLEFLLADAGFTAVQSFANPAAAWEGVDKLLAGVETPPAQIAAPRPLAPLPPLPTPPTNASLRAQWNLRLTDWVWRKFTAQYVQPLRADLEQAHALVAEQAQALEALHTQIRTLAAADRFLYPAREIAVLGYKPAADHDQPSADASAAIRSQ